MSLIIKNIPTEDSLIKHFFILGIDPAIILDSKYFTNIKNISDSHKLTPSVLSLFPSFPKNNINIDKNVLLHHCFPNGFYIKQFSQFPQPEHFTFELNNFPLISKLSSLYFTCLSFYEPIENYNLFKISHDKGVNFAEKYLQTPQNSPSNNINDIGISCPLVGGGYYIEKVIGFISGEYHPNVLTKILYLLHGRYTGHYNTINEPLEKIVENLIFKIPGIKLGKWKLEVNLFKKEHYFEYLPVNSVPLSFVEINRIFERYNVAEVLLIFKCLLLEEPILIFSENKSILTSTFDALLSLLYPFKCSIPHCSILPNNSFGLIESCKNFLFGINQNYNDDFFKMNEIAIFNKKILILDLDKKSKFYHQKFDVIQIDLDNDIEEDIDIFYDKDINDEDDYNKYNYRNLNYELNDNLAKKEVEKEIDLPAHYKKKTYNLIMDYIKILSKYENQNSYYLEIDNLNHKIKEQFSYFLVSILLDYANYLIFDFDTVDSYLFNPENNLNIEKMFDIDGFINSHKVDELFYQKFFHTELFKNFIIKKIYPKSLEDKIDILFFDERIADKKNKNMFGNKVNTPFMYHQFDSYKYKVIIDSNSFSFNEFNYLKNDLDSNQNYFNYYQVIIHRPNTNEILIKYPVFPKLLYDDFYFGKSYLEIYKINGIPPLIMNDIKKNINEISKLIENKEFNSIYRKVNYSLNNYEDSKILKIEHKFILPNVWLALNSLTLNYCQNVQEKNIRFSEIIEKLYDSQYIDLEVISLILMVISKYGTSEQLLITFAKILKNKILLNNYSLHSKVITTLTKNFNSDVSSSKTNIISSRAAILNKKDNNIELINLGNSIFPKRGIYTQDENVQESIEFGLKTMCCYCRKLNQIIYPILMEQKGEQNGVLLQCGNCHNRFSPQIKVNINNKFLESFELISVWDMLQFIKNEFMVNNKFNIDVINFKKNYTNFYWNALFYFSINGLNFDFLLPYVKDNKENLIPNNNIYVNNNSSTQFGELFYDNTNRYNYNTKRKMTYNYKPTFHHKNSENNY